MTFDGSEAGAVPPRLREQTPAAATLGREVLAVEPASREVRVAYDASPSFTNRHGTVSGGFLAAMLDSACAMALLAVLEPGSVPVTTGLDVTYVKPALVGRLTAVARVVDESGRDATCEGTLSAADGTIVATSSARFRILRRPG